MKIIISIMFLFTTVILLAQPDTIINRYATMIDADHWPSVNEGDYVFFSGNGDDGNSIYSKGDIFGITLPQGKKIFIWRGNYWRIKIEGSNCESTATQPTIVTNLGGQVKWGYSTSTERVRGLELWNFDNIHLTGKYDPDNQTGNINYLGHNNGADYDTPNFHENYGLWGNPRWSGYRYNGAFPNIIRIHGFETCKISYVAATEGGFSGFNIKSDNPETPSEVEIDIQDCFTAWTESEGFYISYSTSAINQDITKLTLRNNIMAFCGSESMQTDNLVEGSVIEHNVAFTGACFHRRPFQDYYQDMLHQISFCEGGVTVQNNAMITGSLMHTLKHKETEPGRVSPDVTKKVLFQNNYYGFSRSGINYTWQGDGITPYEIDGNIYGPVSTPSTRDGYTSDIELDHYFRICNSNTDITLKNLTYPEDRPLYQTFCGPQTINEINNTPEVAPILEFVNSGFPDSTDYRNITFWSAEYGTGDKEGIFIPYNEGDYVFYDDSIGYTHFYLCIQDNAGDFDPNLSPEYWNLKTWNGNRLPPLDLRMENGSFYDNLDIGLTYKSLGPNGASNLTYRNASFTIYPNPANSNIRIQSNKEISEIVFKDITGKELFRKDHYLHNNPINIIPFATGVYIAVVKFKNQTIEVQKFIIK